MGKKSKNAKNNKGSEARTVNTDRQSTSSGAAVTFPISTKLELVEPVRVNGVSYHGKEKLSTRFNTPSISDSGTWRVCIRRMNMWFNTQLVKKKRSSPRNQFRSWWVVYMIMEPSGVLKMQAVMVQDEEAVAKNPMVHPMTPSMIMASLFKVMDKVRSRPSKLVFWTAEGGRFRYESILDLLHGLRPLVPKNLVVEPIPGKKVARENIPASCCTGLMYESLHQMEHPEVQLYNRANCQINSILEAGISEVEQKSNKIQIGNPVEGISALDFRRMMKACKDFHDARPWEKLSNLDVLILTVPDIFDHDELGTRKSVQEICQDELLEGRPPITYVAVVAGNGSWHARGVHFYKSWSDMQIVASGQIAPLQSSSQSFMFFQRVLTNFQILDYIEELGIEVSASGGTRDESYPICFSSDKNSLKETSMGSWIEVPPPKEEVPAMALATMAITKFAANEEYCWEKGKNEVFHCIDDPVEIDIDLTGEGRPAGSVVVKIEYHCNTHINMMTPDEMEATMSKGEDSCNFCQKPKAVVKREGNRLSTCSRCKKINYCSKQCQRNDWIRHKQDCRKV
mmetsp:Transcript_5279/g.6784  ORF Transcript_5279/g.6784 Transcript_5279/m.6784 type:complete len:568 (+) Transcript_5279:127-1830(+)